MKQFIKDREINTFILVNPDNPSGNYIPHRDVIHLVEWCKNEGIDIIVDESFSDFSDEKDNTLITEEIMNQYPNLVVMKSISKSYGVPGVRLGILASSNEKLISEMKKEVSIWNINSFAEFYMQIAEKYKNDYKVSLDKLRKERDYLQEELDKITDFRVIPSQANYVMVELMRGKTAKELTQNMLLKYNLFIKDLSSKISQGEYIRLAVRNREDNNKLIYALKNELGMCSCE